MAAYKVTYFDITGLGETIRYLLSYGGFDFEDNRVDMDKWKTIKATMPLCKLPVLEHEGKIAHQHIAICRYLGKQCKLMGKDDWEDLEIDSIADTINDLRGRTAMYYYEQDQTKRSHFKKILSEENMPFYLNKFDEMAGRNGFLASKQLTWVDIYFVSIMDYMSFMMETDVLASYGNLKTLRDHVVNIPNIKKWLEKRPKKTLLNPSYFVK